MAGKRAGGWTIAQIGLPMGLLALIFGLPMVVARVVLERAAAVVMTAALTFLGIGLGPPHFDLAQMAVRAQAFPGAALWSALIPGILLSLIVATWLGLAAVFARSGASYWPVGWAHTMS